MKLIDKADLVARIKKLKMDIGNIFNEYDEGFWEGRTTAFDDIIYALDTLEVKEVDIEKEIANQYESNYEDYLTYEEFADIAKHFFELGIKAQKGKEV